MTDDRADGALRHMPGRASVARGSDRQRYALAYGLILVVKLILLAGVLWFAASRLLR
jgi:hypothetical protein